MRKLYSKICYESDYCSFLTYLSTVITLLVHRAKDLKSTISDKEI